MSKKSDSQANLASPQAKGQQGGQQKEDKPAPKKGGKQGMEDPKLSGKGKGPVKQEPPPPGI